MDNARNNITPSCRNFIYLILKHKCVMAYQKQQQRANGCYLAWSAWKLSQTLQSYTRQYSTSPSSRYVTNWLTTYSKVLRKRKGKILITLNGTKKFKKKKRKRSSGGVGTTTVATINTLFFTYHPLLSPSKLSPLTCICFPLKTLIIWNMFYAQTDHQLV